MTFRIRFDLLKRSRAGRDPERDGNYPAMDSMMRSCEGRGGGGPTPHTASTALSPLRGRGPRTRFALSRGLYTDDAALERFLARPMTTRGAGFAEARRASWRM